MKHTRVIVDPMRGASSGVTLERCVNCIDKAESCYEEDCRAQLDALKQLAKYESITHDADGSEVISLDRLRELVEDEIKGRSTGFHDRNGNIIREHDIIRVTFLDRYSGKEYLREECEVIFDKGAFGVMWGREGQKEFNVLCSFCVGTTVFYEIIGHKTGAEGEAER